MALSITNSLKSDLEITNINKSAPETWNDADYTWDEATGIWDVPGVVLARANKNNLTIININKN